MKNIALRIDDIGASSKKYEVYSNYPFCNFLFIKYIYPFKAWGPYNELTVDEWKIIFDILVKYNAKLTVGVTCSWVSNKSELIPFYDKFPKQSEILKQALDDGLIDIANHGNTHCVLGKHLPQFFSSNRNYHREFWDYLDYEIHNENLNKSQKILNEWIGYKPKLLIPPGNVYSKKTIRAAEANSIELINSHLIIRNQNVKIIDNDDVFAFHDKDLKQYGGFEWLKNNVKKLSKENNFIFVKDLSNE